jgi:putative RNA 2'-phosphotransferase
MNSDDGVTRPPAAVLDDEKAERLSRFLALVLRHRALMFDLPMDEEGFVPIDDILDLMAERQRSLDWVEPEHIETLAQNQGRQRFEVRDDRVRATYGHSFSRPIFYPAVEPPDQLFVAMPPARVAEARQKGLRPQGRQYVHLSKVREEALEIGRHHDPNASAVTVRAHDAHEQGIKFHRPTEGIFLVAQVPPEFLDIEIEYGRPPRKSRRR